MVGVPVKSVSDKELRRFLRLVHDPLPEPQLEIATTVLPIIDVQHYGCYPDWGMGMRSKERGFAEELGWHWDRVRRVMLPNIQLLMATARRLGVEVIHSRVSALTVDGRDTTKRYKALGISTSREAKEAQLLPDSPREMRSYSTRPPPASSTRPLWTGCCAKWASAT